MLEYVLSALGIVFTGLFTWIAKVATKWLNSKIKNKYVAELASSIVVVVTNAVKATYQSYVEGLKGTDAWTKDAQEKALQMALETAKTELTTEALAYIQEQHGDINSYLKTLIESVLYDLKNKNTSTTTEN
jgi:hypothetical protein